MMKKLLAFLLCFVLLVSTAACSADAPQISEPMETTEATEATELTTPAAEVITEEVKAKLDAVLEEYKFEGIVYLTHNGKVVYRSVSGANDMGEPLTIDSPMYICSISKQFCAAAIVMLRDQGKLSLDDTLDKYFPEYTIGKDITLKNLLTMRSGICRDYTLVWKNPALYAEKPPEEINAEMMEWIFSQPLNFEPDTKFEYSNINYILLSYVVEMVSGQSYEDFIRQNIFQPLGMTHSGFLTEVPDHPEWGLTYDNIYAGSVLGDQPQGCGDIVTTAANLDIWMTALKSGQVVSEESYREMTTNYSVGQVEKYGYGLMGGIRDGWGHSGGNLHYTSRMFFSEEYGYNFFIVTGNTPTFRPDSTERAYAAFLRTLFEAVDAAAPN